MNRESLRSLGWPLLVLLALTVALAGCQRGPKTAAVSGKITVSGEPLKIGEIVFMPTTGRMAHGKIQPDGTYELTTFDAGDGALIGEHTVTIEALIIESNAPEPKTLEEELAMKDAPSRLIVKETRLVPEEYSDVTTSPLRATVEKKKINEINFDL